MRISDWSSDVCSSDLFRQFGGTDGEPVTREATSLGSGFIISPDGYVVTNNHVISGGVPGRTSAPVESITVTLADRKEYKARVVGWDVLSDLALLKVEGRSEEHTSELQSLMRISYAVFCLKKKNINIHYREH